MDPPRYDDMRRGAYDPIARLDDMDLEGVWASACFPSYPGFAGARFSRANDKDLALECVRAYNDYVIEEWCAAAPERYISLVILPMWDREACVEEIERTAAMGANGITFPDNPAHLGLPSWYSGEWDDTLSAAEEADLPLNMHFGTSGFAPPLAKERPQAAATACMGFLMYPSLVDLTYSPTLPRHPRLKIAYSEGGIGWIPYALEKLDTTWETWRHYQVTPTIDAEIRPSDLVRKHLWGCFISDAHGLNSRDVIGVDRIMWEADYPHADSLWPNSRKVAAEQLADVPNDEVRRIVELNAREFFDFHTQPTA